MSGILVRLLERTAPPAPARRSESAILDAILSGMAARTAAGISVSPDTALTYGAVYACVRVLAESISSLPLILYRRLPNGGKERATDHRLYSILHDAPNPEMSSADWREAQMVNMALWGNGYSQVIPDRAGRVLELWPMLSRHMEIKRDRAGGLVYQSSDPSVRTPELPMAQMLHVRSMSLNGITGISPVSMARQAIGLGLATELYGSAFFGNGANPGIILKHPAKLSDDAYSNLQRSWAERSGVANAHKPAILEEGMTIDKIGVPPDDAQFLETRLFQVGEIARWFRIPPHKIGELSHATFSNIEHQGLDFVVHSLRPWLVRWEQSISRALLTPAERTGLYAEFLVDGMLRGDVVSRYNAYSIARQWGWMSVNDVRERENMNPVPGGDGYMAPLNMVPLDKFGQAPAPAAAPTADGGDGDVRGNTALAALGYVYRDAVIRITRRLQRDVAAAARKHLSRDDRDTFVRWLDQVAGELRDYAAAALMPIAQTQIALTGQRMQDPGRKIGRWATSWLRYELDYIRELVDGARVARIDMVEVVDDCLRRYDDPQQIGEWSQIIALQIAAEGDE